MGEGMMPYRDPNRDMNERRGSLIIHNFFCLAGGQLVGTYQRFQGQYLKSAICTRDMKRGKRANGLISRQKKVVEYGKLFQLIR